VVEVTRKVRVVPRIRIWELDGEYVRRHKVPSISLDIVSNSKLDDR
jgi:hypothetical protein